MGIGSFLFGGPRMLPGTQDDIGRLGDLAGRQRAYGESVGLGMSGHTAKGLLKAMGRGDWDTNPVLAAYLNPIRNQTAVAQAENERRARLGVNAIAPGEQIGLLNAQTNLANQRAQQSGALAMAELVPQLYGQASNQYSAARGQRIGAEQNALSNEADIIRAMAEMRMRGTYQSPGLIGRLGQIAGLGTAMIPGLSAIGALGRSPAGGSYFSNPRSPYYVAPGSPGMGSY